MKRSKPPGSARKRVNNLNYGSTKDPVQVYCRLRPMQYPSDTCMRIISDTTLTVRMPESVASLRNGNASKEIRTTFSRVFEPETTQKEIFDVVALPLIENIIRGRNSLLFTYGVTGSGKTYTMTGDSSDPGIMPRCLDALFNSVANHQTKKFVFKPDKLNGFDIQSEADAMLDRQSELHAGLYSQKASRFARQASDPLLMINRSRNESRSIQVDQDSLYAVFVTYVEIYNNSVYDLLEEEDESRGGNPGRPLQSKIVREDGNKNMYVHGVTEIETKSTEEALEVFQRGQRRRRVAHTSLNVESSRSHSVFTIRLIQAPLDQLGEQIIQDKRVATVAQLSLVDLAGSERINRTKNTGQRLREAGNINNSLMTLRSCLEILRENQLTGSNKIVPYRDSKLTHLFKNYFDGDGQVRMIICVNPRSEDYDETLHVLKFAEITQEIQTSKPAAIGRIELGLVPGRGKPLKVQAKEPIYSLAPAFPEFELNDAKNDEVLSRLIRFLEQRIEKRDQLRTDLNGKRDEFRKTLTNVEREQMDLRIENSTLKATNVQQKRKLDALEGHLGKTEEQKENLQRKLEKANETIRNLQSELKERDLALNQRLIDKQRVKQRYNHKMQAETDKMNKELEMKLRQQREQLQNQMKEKEDKWRLVKQILVDEKTEITDVPREVGKESRGRRDRACLVGNKRYRRSQSADRWVDHRPGAIVPVGTVLQPLMRRRRSITKLTSPKEITEGASRYCLVAQEFDTDGELETKLFKGDIIPTSGGGAQVVFNDMECLKQSSPIARKRSGEHSEESKEKRSDDLGEKRPRKGSP
ncbi:kinesin-like protein KIF23 isoform X2 [Ceratina calcarata]|uniref:Kinesin-like protein n=1 Tax=Ceratina calcarata TaxID=156304 RepID=A0AAJ7J723_9HYME|nr:kinesin-like protein KIF23 isoform X2 [Ceratina calcarata]